MPNNTAKTELFGQWTQGSMVIADQGKSTGSRFWVSSGTGSDAAGYGRSPDHPLATLDYAIGLCTDNKKDMIYLMPGHSETKSVTGSFWAADVAGMRIIGLGQGADRPTFTFSHTGAAATISAASVYIENILLVAGTDSVTAPLTISAADVTLKDVEIRDTTDIEFVAGVITTAAADRLTIDGLFYNGYTGGDACTIGIKLVGADGFVIKNSRFDGLFSTGCINFVTTACTKGLIENCAFLNTGTAVTKNIVESVASNTWRAVGCYDGVAGYDVAGSSVNGLRYVGGKIASVKSKTTMPNNTAVAMFNYIGAIRVYEVFAVVTTGIQAQATAVKFQAQGSTEAAAVDLCATLDINAFDAGSVARATLDFSDAALGADDVATVEGEAYAAQPAIIYSLAATGAINLHSAAASTGALDMYVVWEPISAGAYVKPA